jgi:hypothetical protein
MKVLCTKKLVFARYNPKVPGFFPENGQIRPLTLLYTCVTKRLLSYTEFEIHMDSYSKALNLPENGGAGDPTQGAWKHACKRSEQSWGEFRGEAMSLEANRAALYARTRQLTSQASIERGLISCCLIPIA